MNKVIVKNLDKYQPGDLFVNKKHNEMFILCELSNDEYVCISIERGIPWMWHYKEHTLENAIEDLTFYGRNLTITIKDK